MDTISLIKFTNRVLQAVWALVLLGCSAWGVDVMYKLSVYRSYPALSAQGLAVFSAVTGMIIAIIYAVVTLKPDSASCSGRKASGLPEFVVSTIWSVFFLASFAAIAAQGMCGVSAGVYCSTWNATAAMAFLLWIQFTASAVLAFLDWRRGHAPSAAPMTKDAKKTTEMSAVQNV
eukprot:jgi/Chrzof1/3838/Cz13g10190.t1